MVGNRGFEFLKFVIETSLFICAQGLVLVGYVLYIKLGQNK